MPSTESYQLLLAAAAACEDKKAEDIRILALDPAESGLTDYFLICNGTNDRQNVAITDEVELRLKRDFGTYPNSVEGRRVGEWILMDYIDFVVHIFTEATREFYDIERLRKSARSLGPAELSATLREKTEAARKKAPSRKALPPGETAALTLAGPAGAPAKKAAKKALAKHPPAKKSPAKHAPEPKKAAAKKAPAKSPARKTPARKAAKKSAALAKPATQSASQANVQDTSRRALPSGPPARKQLPPPTKT